MAWARLYGPGRLTPTTVRLPCRRSSKNTHTMDGPFSLKIHPATARVFMFSAILCGSILAIANPADPDMVTRQVRILNRRLKPRLSRKDVNRVARCCGTTAQKWSNDTIVMLLGMTKEEAKAFSAPIEESEGKN